MYLLGCEVSFFVYNFITNEYCYKTSDVYRRLQRGCFELNNYNRSYDVKLTYFSRIVSNALYETVDQRVLFVVQWYLNILKNFISYPGCL